MAKTGVRKTGNLVSYVLSPQIGSRLSPYPEINWPGHYSRSLSSQSNIPAQNLIRFANTIPAARCIRRISTTISSQHWLIQHKDLDELSPTQKEKARKEADKLERNLKKPNEEAFDCYFHDIVSGLIKNILIFNFGFLERQKGAGDRAFWLWLVDRPQDIDINPDWTPDVDGVVAKYLDRSHVNELGYSDPLPIKSEFLFPIQGDNSSSLSPLEIAYDAIEGWLGVSNFQRATTTNATREYMLILKDITSEEELDTFRTYWDVQVRNSGKIPILNGDVAVTKMGARNDEELYLKYEEYLRRMISLAFGMTPLDMNISEHDNRATAGISADRSFQDSIGPLMQKIEALISWEVIEYYYPDFFFRFNDLEKRNEKEEADTATNLFKEGLITKNEARLRINEKPVADGDEFKEGGNPDEEHPPGNQNNPQDSSQQQLPNPKDDPEEPQKENQQEENQGKNMKNLKPGSKKKAEKNPKKPKKEKTKVVASRRLKRSPKELNYKQLSFLDWLF